MNVTRHTDANFAAQLDRAVRTSSLFDPDVEERARGIVEQVRAKGDAALAELTEKFDGAKVAASQLGRCCGWEEERYCRCRCRCRLHLIVVIVACDDDK